MMMKNRIALLATVLLLGGDMTLGAATQPKFRPSGSGDPGIGRYVVTLTEESASEDVAAMKRELAVLYGARLEGTASPDVRQFAVTMMPVRARLLSADPRVIEVAEVPSTTTAAAPPQTPAVAPAPVLLPRRFTPQPSGYGDNGQSGTYTYDGAGNITAIGADTFVYDSAQRLASSVTRGVQENYTYDAYGNRTSATGAVNCLGQTNCAQTVTVDSNTNHITTINGAAVTYDAAGNISTIAATSTTPGAVYSYDALGTMTRATVGSDDRQFIYNADNERIAVRQGVSWTWMIRDQSGKVLREFTSLESGSGPTLAMANWQWAKDYVWRDGLLLATVSPSGTSHYHLDHLGTPRLVTDANGMKVAEHAYYPFGAEINLTPHETPEEAMKFTGHERDIVAGDGHTLDYMHARFYNASVGRFLSVDPTWGSADLGRPQSWNRYSYVMNNPVAYTDPTGKIYELYGFVNDADEQKFFQDLSTKTGLTVTNNNGKLDYARDANGNATVATDANGNQLGSATARTDLMNGINSTNRYIVQRTDNNPNVDMGVAQGSLIRLDFADMRQVNTGNNPSATFDSSMIFMHEGVGHAFLGLHDPARQMLQSNNLLLQRQTGATVNWENKIRSELSLPLRSQYRTEVNQQGRRYIPFANGPVWLP